MEERTNTGGLTTGIDSETAKERRSYRMQQLERQNAYGGCSKILGRIIVTRIRNGIDNQFRQEQAGFRKCRGATEQIFTLRNIIEQCIEWNANLYVCFVDFEKAFDPVDRSVV